MHKRHYYIVNGITLYRLLSAPFLVYLALQEDWMLFRWLLVLSFATDAVDGFLARYFHVSSVFGAKLDSIADDLTILVGIFGMLMYRPAFLEQHLVVFLVLLALFIVQVALALYRYGKMTSFHTYGAKLAAVFQGVFLILFFFMTEPSLFLFYLAMIVTGLELVEEIILVILIPEWRTNVKGLFWVMRKKKTIQPKSNG